MIHRICSISIVMIGIILIAASDDEFDLTLASLLCLGGAFLYALGLEAQLYLP